MAKSFRIMGALLAGAVAIATGIGWWLGPELVSLALLDPRRGEPFTLIDFTRGPSTEVHAARYRQPLAGIVASEGGVLVDGYHLSHLVMGKRGDEWPFMYRLHLLQARDLVQIMTSAPYRLMLEGFPELDHLALGSYQRSEKNWRRVLVAGLVCTSDEGRMNNTAALDPLAPVLDLLKLGRGRLVWDTEVIAMDQDTEWGRMVVLDFFNEEEALEWLRLPEVVAARTLSNVKARCLALGLYERAGS